MISPSFALLEVALIQLEDDDDDDDDDDDGDDDAGAADAS